MKLIKTLLASLLMVFMIILVAQPALAFCGFYVAKADTKLYNQASQVIITRNGQRTVLTMANDYQGNVKDFALVVPVPVVLQEDQVKIGDAKVIERLDSFSAPRLVEYFDSNPCEVRSKEERQMMPQSANLAARTNSAAGGRSLGVTIENRFSVGEYDILILSAKESSGLETWLRQNGYKIPQGARELLAPYIRQNLKFFVAKVNLKEFTNQGFSKLRPLMMAFESPKFMLPIRLGMVNAQKEQDLVVYLLSPKGQIEVTNYRTNKIPSNVNIPEFVQQEFAGFYKSMFTKAYNQEGRNIAFIEYAWDMGSCDPCSAEPLNPEELKKAGVFWLNEGQWGNVFITRLHVRYTRDKFPEDLTFQETANREFFQGRYVIRHPYTGEANCSAAGEYRSGVRRRQEEEAQTLARLTNWKIEDIRKRIDFMPNQSTPWWQRLWN